MLSKKYYPIVSFLMVVVSVYFAYDVQLPHIQNNKNNPSHEFSLDSARIHLKKISQKPHFVGSDAHAEVRDYLVTQLQKMGLQPHVQIQEVFNQKWQVGTQTYNVLARIKGSEVSSKAVLLLTHYDSSPHASPGASDAGSGVVTILEGVRAYLASGKKPKNDIIILFSDAEELGLLGAKAFVNHHPWAKEVGIVLNFEARGSGGPSYMLLETNGGNTQLIRAFQHANTSHPVGNSLMYSVYKMLPNDTDLTVFREEGNIDGFNFAFIDNHFDYHSQQDTYERLNQNTLLHQGTYCTALLDYFAQSDLTQLKSSTDLVYFNFPVIGMVYYPFTWVFPIVIVFGLLFIVVSVKAFYHRQITVKKVLQGFVPLLVSLFLAFAIGWLGWKMVLWLAPNYREILHGFPYNGNWLIIGFLATTIAVFWRVYTPYFQKRMLPELLFAPLFVWLLLNIGVAYFLKGAGFFILPFLTLLIIWIMIIFSKRVNNRNIVMFIVLALPSIIIFSPLLYMFPVGLGLKNVVISTILVILLLSILLPVFEGYTNKKSLPLLFGFIAVLAFALSYYYGRFNEEQKFPNSVLYFADKDTKEAYFASYDYKTDAFTQQFLSENPQKGDLSSFFSSKYKTPIRLYHKSSWITLTPPLVTKVQNDSLYPDKSVWSYTIVKTRNTAQWYISSADSLSYYDFECNGVLVEKNELNPLKKQPKAKVVSYFLTPEKDSLHLKLVVPKGHQPKLDLYDISYDLLENPNFKHTSRSQSMMPKPFVINDATVLKLKL